MRLTANDAALDVMVASPGEPDLSIELRPLEPGAPAYRTTAQHLVRYRGSRDLSAALRQVIDAVIEEVERPGAMPARFRGVATLGDEPDRLSPESFARRFPFAQVDLSTGPRGAEREVLLRLTPACNQHCAFCSAPTFAAPSAEAVRACIDFIAAELAGAQLTLTGGEPTLCPTFADSLSHALDKPEIARVLVQTNAVAFGTAGRASRLPKTERLAFFVSLHALDPAIYDEMTASSGQLPLAIEGIRNLLAAKQAVTLNTVVTSANLAHLPAMIEALGDTFAPSAIGYLHFSTLMCPPHRPDAEGLLARYSDIAPVLLRVAERAAELGIAVEPLVSSTHASVPLCLVSDEERRRATHRPEIGPDETGYEDLSRSWVKANACRACPADKECLGVPAPYARRFGLAELRPFIP